MPEIALMPDALRVLQARGQRRDAARQAVDAPEAMLRRSAAHGAEVEKPYGDRPDAAAEANSPLSGRHVMVLAEDTDRAGLRSLLALLLDEGDRRPDGQVIERVA